MKKTLRKIIVCLISVIFVTGIFSINNIVYAERKVNINAQSGIILLDDTDEVLWGKNLDYVCDAASTTKLITSLVALEFLDLTDTVDYLDYNMTIEELLHYVLIESDNEAAEKLIEAYINKTGNTYDDFIKAMNEKATEIGCVNTVFYNPSGLYFENMTCAKDLVLIAKSAFLNEDILRICKISTYTSEIGEVLHSTNVFLYGYEVEDENGQVYNVKKRDDVIAGKTGTFHYNQTNMVVLCNINGMNCYIAILDSNTLGRFVDIETLINEAYNLINPYLDFEMGTEFGKGKIWNGETNYVVGIAKEDGLINLPEGISLSLVTSEAKYEEKLSAPIKEGDRIGTISISIAGDLVKTVPLVAKEDVDEGWFLSKYRITNKQTLIMGGILLLIIFLFIMLLSIRARNLKRKKQMKEKMLRDAAKKKLLEEKDHERRNWTYK